MEKHTHREYLTWLAWLDKQWNIPDRHDTYLMQIACEIRRTILKDPNNIQANQFKMKFIPVSEMSQSVGEKSKDITEEQERILKEQASAESLKAWFGRLAKKPKVIKSKKLKE